MLGNAATGMPRLCPTLSRHSLKVNKRKVHKQTEQPWCRPCARHRSPNTCRDLRDFSEWNSWSLNPRTRRRLSRWRTCLEDVSRGSTSTKKQPQPSGWGCSSRRSTKSIHLVRTRLTSVRCPTSSQRRTPVRNRMSLCSATRRTADDNGPDGTLFRSHTKVQRHISARRHRPVRSHSDLANCATSGSAHGGSAHGNRSSSPRRN